MKQQTSWLHKLLNKQDEEAEKKTDEVPLRRNRHQQRVYKRSVRVESAKPLTRKQKNRREAKKRERHARKIGYRAN